MSKTKKVQIDITDVYNNIDEKNSLFFSNISLDIAVKEFNKTLLNCSKQIENVKLITNKILNETDTWISIRENLYNSEVFKNSLTNNLKEYNISCEFIKEYVSNYSESYPIYKCKFKKQDNNTKSNYKLI